MDLRREANRLVGRAAVCVLPPALLFPLQHPELQLDAELRRSHRGKKFSFQAPHVFLLSSHFASRQHVSHMEMSQYFVFFFL